jgi:CubicO group peptidase (beta-lactamase class C family)
VFDVTLLTQMVRQRELDFEDPVVKYVPELQRGRTGSAFCIPERRSDLREHCLARTTRLLD